MRSILLTLNLSLAIGCARNSPTRIDASADVTSPNTIRLGDELFPVESCTIWGYLGKKDDVWYCRWCFDAEAQTRTFRSDDDEPYDYEVTPRLSANTVPIAVERWHDLDGVSFTTGEHGDVDFYRGHDTFYTIQTMSSYETCSHNRVTINHIKGNEFRLRWRGETYVHGVDTDEFELDAIAVFKDVTLSSEVDSESDVDDDEIGRIFREVFRHGDFIQHPAEIRSFTEDGERYIDFTASFTPK